MEFLLNIVLATCGRLQFYFGSRRGPLGHGAGERPPKSVEGAIVDPRDCLVAAAAEGNDVRQALSNFASFPLFVGTTFKLSPATLAEAAAGLGAGWNPHATADVDAIGRVAHALFAAAPDTVLEFTSTEHAFHFLKLVVIGQGEKAKQFCLCSGSDLASTCDGGIVKSAGGKKGIHAMTPEERAAWAAVSPSVLKALTWLKFSPAYPGFNDRLCVTGRMALVHAFRGVEQEWNWLYMLRADSQRARGVVF